MVYKKTIAIIGWGAAGLMTAARLLESEKSMHIDIFEKNSRLGAKVLISGGGRCNVTTGNYKKKDLLDCYPRWASFLSKHAFKVFWPKKIYKRFETQGVPLKIEKDMRVFPLSDDGNDIAGIFEKLFRPGKKGNTTITIHYRESVEQVSPFDRWNQDAAWCSGPSCPKIKRFLVSTNKGLHHYDAVVIATGWNAYGHTGSNGDGYQFAENFGHTVSPRGPSLNSFMTQEKRIHKISGLSLPDAILRTQIQGKTYMAKGPLLFTHFGISGPAVFALSSHMAYETISESSPSVIQIQLDAQYSTQQREQQYQELFAQHAKKEIKNVLWQIFPKRLVTQLLSISDIHSEKQAAHINKSQRKQLAQISGSNMLIHAIQRRPGDEFVTAWGVSLEEVDPTSMESKLFSGLYFAWEVLDIDGHTWWYNLSASRATGYVVAESITSKQTH